MNTTRSLLKLSSVVVYKYYPQTIELKRIINILQLQKIYSCCEKLSTVVAALNGHLDCLKYAHENGCEWDEDTCSEAALNGHLDCLKYAHENGCENF